MSNNQLATIPEKSVSSICKVAGNLNVEIFQKSREERIGSCAESIMMEKVAGVMDFIMRDMGVRTTPDTYSRVRMSQFIVRRYSDLSLSELKLAFELAVIGELNVDEKDVKHYNDFSILYVSRILNAYKTKRRESIHNVTLALPQPEIKPTQEEIEKIHTQFINVICNLYDKQKGGEDVTHRFTGIIYDYLNRLGLIKISATTKKQFMVLAKMKLADQATSINALHRVNFLALMDTSQILEAKRMTIRKQFENYIKKNADLKQLITKAETVIQD